MNPAPRTFRVFVSSTFQDLKAERDMLQQRVFPRLRELCAAHGARFQAVDLRWGVSEQASLDQQTVPICLAEIARCQETTPRPNFVVLLGDRYGWRPLPAEIPALEFETIKRHLDDPAGETLLTAWYRRDDNAVPPVYCLLPRAGRFEEEAVWTGEVEEPLGHALRRTVAAAGLTSDQRLVFETSATHQEIVRGALQVEDAKEHVFCFLREIAGLPGDEQARDYADFDGDGWLDGDAGAALGALKSALQETLPGHVHTYRTRWEGDGISGEHLDALGDDVYGRLAEVITAELARLEALDPLTVEIGEHRAFGEERRRSFTGRTADLASIAGYLSRDNHAPLAIVGEPGAGKTAALAEAARRAQETRPEAEVIVRFVGATPSSRDGRSLLEGLCREICRRYDVGDAKVPADYQALVDAFPGHLALATATRPLVVVLDALDQLAAAEDAGNLIWLPAELPENSRIVVTSTPGRQEGILQAKLPPSNLIDLAPMAPEEAGALLDAWLAEAGRRLQPEQRDQVLVQSAASGLPLYLRLAFEEARRWRSYTTVGPLPADIPGILRTLLARLSAEVHHGEALVTRSLGYLAAARNGLTEDELMDLLSADGAVMADFLRRSPKSPRAGRLPVAVWSRLHFDLAPYLSEQRADGTTTLGFYHPTTFGRLVAELTLRGDAEAARHRELAAYFAAEPERPPVPDGSRRPALRRLSELPYQQAHAGLWDELRATLTDFTFLVAKVGAAGPWALVEDYAEASRCGYDGEDLPAIEDAVRLSAHVTAADPDQLAGQLAGRLGEEASPAVQALLEQVRRWDAAPWLRPTRPTLMPSGGPLRQTLRSHGEWIEAVAVTPDGRRAVSGGDDGMVRVWDLQRGTELVSLAGHTAAVTDVTVTPDGRRAVSASVDGTLRYWDLARAMAIRTWSGHEGPVTAVAVTSGGERAISGGADGTLRVWDLAQGDRAVGTLSGHSDWVQGVAVTADGSRAVSAADDGTVGVWDLGEMRLHCSLRGHSGSVNDVTLTPDGWVAASAGADKSIRLWDLARGTSLRTIAGHGDSVRCVAITPDGKTLASGSDDGTVRTWNLADGSPRSTLAGHTEGVWDIAVTPDSRSLVSASGDGTLRVWDLGRGEDERPLLGHPGWSVRGLAVTPDGRRAISAGGDGTLGVWDLATGKAVCALEGHSGQVNAVVVTPDGRRAVSAATDRTLRIWDLTRGQEIRAMTGHTSWVNTVAITPDGRWAISASHDQSLSLWDLAQGTEVRPLVGHTGDVTGVVVVPDGERALSASWDGQVILWELGRGRRLREVASGMRGIRALALATGGRQVIIGGEEIDLRVLDLESGQLVSKLRGHHGTVWSLAPMPGGRLLSASEDRTLRVWDLARGETIATFTGESALLACAAAPDGRTVVAGERQGRLHILRLEGRTRGIASQDPSPSESWPVGR